MKITLSKEELIAVMQHMFDLGKRNNTKALKNMIQLYTEKD